MLKWSNFQKNGQNRSSRVFKYSIFHEYKWSIKALLVGIFQKFKNQFVQKMFYLMKPLKNKNVRKTVKITITRGYHPLNIDFQFLLLLGTKVIAKFSPIYKFY